MYFGVRFLRISLIFVETINKKNKFMRKLLFTIAASLLLVTVYAQNMKAVKLNTPDKARGTSVMKALSDRHSDREFAVKELSLQDLSHLLWAANGINRPDGMILAYALITSGKYAHKGSFYKLCGSKEATEEEMKRFSLELHVDETSTPAFIWHTVTDTCVPVQNSLLLVNALLEHGVSLEAHIFPEGVHGLALANKETWTGQEHLNMPHVQCWVDLAIRWTQDQF